jgi:hypothetical protein
MGSDANPSQPSDGGVWEIRAHCLVCTRTEADGTQTPFSTIVRYIFEAGPGWPAEGFTRGDPDVFARRFGPEGTSTTLLTRDELQVVWKEGLARFHDHLRDLKARPGDTMLPNRVAEAAASALRPIRELMTMGNAEQHLPPEPIALQRELELSLSKIGR